MKFRIGLNNGWWYVQKKPAGPYEYGSLLTCLWRWARQR